MGSPAFTIGPQVIDTYISQRLVVVVSDDGVATFSVDSIGTGGITKTPLVLFTDPTFMPTVGQEYTFSLRRPGKITQSGLSGNFVSLSLDKTTMVFNNVSPGSYAIDGTSVDFSNA